jgi:hypothetical protein
LATLASRVCALEKRKPIPEKIARIWAEEWAKEGKEIDWHKLLSASRL